MVLLLDILSSCSELGDKALVFSQSLSTLDLVEFYLSKLQVNGKEGKYWKQGKDWYRCTFTLCILFFIHKNNTTISGGFISDNFLLLCFVIFYAPSPVWTVWSFTGILASDTRNLASPYG